MAVNSVKVSPQTPGFFSPLALLSTHTSDLWTWPPFFPSIIPTSLPGLVDINLEHSPFFPMVLHVALRASEREALWPTSISVTCQDLWEMESKPDRPESVLLKPTPGPPWDVMDERPRPRRALPASLHSPLLPPPCPPFISHDSCSPLPISPVLLCCPSWPSRSSIQT